MKHILRLKTRAKFKKKIKKDKIYTVKSGIDRVVSKNSRPPNVEG